MEVVVSRSQILLPKYSPGSVWVKGLATRDYTLSAGVE